jgi:hypothetical protein
MLFAALAAAYDRGSIMETRTVQTLWHCMTNAESALWNHDDERLRLKFRRLMFSAALQKAKRLPGAKRRILIFDQLENSVAQQTID